MKISISDRKKFFPIFLLFTLLFLISLLCLVLLGKKSLPPPVSETMTKSDSLIRSVVVIDAGHGGEDGGTVGVNGVYEKDLNLNIALFLADWLRADGYEVVLTRTEDLLLYDKNSDYRGQKKIQDLATRRRIAEEYENAVFISIHMNAFPEAKYRGPSLVVQR